MEQRLGELSPRCRPRGPGRPAHGAVLHPRRGPQRRLPQQEFGLKRIEGMKTGRGGPGSKQTLRSRPLFGNWPQIGHPPAAPSHCAGEVRLRRGQAHGRRCHQRSRSSTSTPCLPRIDSCTPCEGVAKGRRACSKIISRFRIPSSGHLWPGLNREILKIGPRFLRFRSIEPSQT